MTTMGVVTNSLRNLHSFYAVDLRTSDAFVGYVRGEIHDGTAVRALTFGRDGCTTASL